MKKAIRRLLAALILLALDGLAMFVFHRRPEYFFPVYRQISQKWIVFLSGLTSFVKVAVWDIGAVVLLAAVIVTLVVVIIRRRGFLSWLSGVLLGMSVLWFIVVCGWMLNHYAPPLAQELGFTVREYSKDELYDACDYYLRKAGEYAVQADRDDGGHLVIRDFYKIAESAGSAYERVSEIYPVLTGSSVRVKKLSVIGEYLMYNGIIGMFMPLTAEAGVPGSVPPAPLPYTMTHEAAHRLGIASEEEANFAAFLACVHHPDTIFLYSGYYSAFSYCFSSLYKIDPELAAELYHKYDEQEGIQLLQQDRRDTSEIYKKYESPMKEISDQINDTYLKTFSEESGIQSYGEVTDDLIAWYLAMGGDDE